MKVCCYGMVAPGCRGKLSMLINRPKSHRSWLMMTLPVLASVWLISPLINSCAVSSIPVSGARMNTAFMLSLRCLVKVDRRGRSTGEVTGERIAERSRKQDAKGLVQRWSSSTSSTFGSGAQISKRTSGLLGGGAPRVGGRRPRVTGGVAHERYRHSRRRLARPCRVRHLRLAAAADHREYDGDLIACARVDLEDPPERRPSVLEDEIEGGRRRERLADDTGVARAAATQGIDAKGGLPRREHCEAHLGEQGRIGARSARSPRLRRRRTPRATPRGESVGATFGLSLLTGFSVAVKAGRDKAA